MAYREVTRVEIQGIIRRWQAGEGYRRIASGTGLSRNTVRKYLTAAKAEGIARDGPVPTDDQLCRSAGTAAKWLVAPTSMPAAFRFSWDSPAGFALLWRLWLIIPSTPTR